jgi:hypothetical protein
MVSSGPRLLRLMNASVPNINPRQTPPIQSRHPLHYLLLGYRLSKYRIRQGILVSGCDPHIPRILRGVSLPLHDVAPMQLVQARRTCYTSCLPI